MTARGPWGARAFCMSLHRNLGPSSPRRPACPGKVCGMACTCVVGLQWGDEAKGKIVDWLTDQHDLVVRYNGGANAGHTVVRGGKTYKFSLLPTGILRPNVKAVIGNGLVVNPVRFFEEVNQLRQNGVAIGEGRSHIGVGEGVYRASGSGWRVVRAGAGVSGFSGRCDLRPVQAGVDGGYGSW